MRNTQKILYKIGKIVSFVLLGIYALTLLINIIMLIVHAVNDNYIGGDITGIVVFIIYIALIVVMIILAGKYTEDAEKAPVDGLMPVILLMVFGLLSGNLLYLVGGVFGIIGASQEKNASEKKEEQPKEESKEEPEQKAE